MSIGSAIWVFILVQLRSFKTYCASAVRKLVELCALLLTSVLPVESPSRIHDPLLYQIQQYPVANPYNYANTLFPVCYGQRLKRSRTVCYLSQIVLNVINTIEAADHRCLSCIIIQDRTFLYTPGTMWEQYTTVKPDPNGNIWNTMIKYTINNG